MQQLITDRTALDISNKTSKGYYNISDIERIIEHVTYLANNLNITINSMVFDYAGYFTFDEINCIINNVKAIRNDWHIASNTPLVPSADNYNYTSANNLELNLKAMEEFLYSYLNDKIYSGMYVSGGNRI